MSFFISDAMAQAAPATQGNPIASFLPLILLFVVFYFPLIRPQQKKAKEHKQMIEALKKGDEIVTQGGIIGKVTDLGETYLTVEVAKGVEIKLQNHAVAAVLPKGTLKNL
jgi:preprotein translocase subunit YajC